MGVTSEQDCRNMNRFVVSCAFLAVASLATLVRWSVLQSLMLQLWLVRLTTATLLDPLLLRTSQSTVLLDRELSRLARSVLLLVTSTLLLELSTSLSQPPPMLPELLRTLLRPELCPPQSSPLLQLHTLPFLQLQSPLVPLRLTP